MIDKLVEKIKKTQAPIEVGLDPMLSYVPDHVKAKAYEEFGETLEGAAEAIWQFNKAIVDATCDLIPAVKPQIAMYEQFGVPGVAAFKKTVDYCHEKGLLVIGDIKRGDIGSTSGAYATGHLGTVTVGSHTYSGFDEDFVTINPYMGTDSVQPFIDVAIPEKKGMFILTKTSNPSSGEFQDQLVNGRPLYELVAQKVVEWGRAYGNMRLQLCRCGCGRNLSGNGRSAAQTDAADLYSCAWLWRSGCERLRPGELF